MPVGETVGLGVIPAVAEGFPEGVGVNRTEAVRLRREDVDAEGEKVDNPPQGNRWARKKSTATRHILFGECFVAKAQRV